MCAAFKRDKKSWRIPILRHEGVVNEDLRKEMVRSNIVCDV